MVYGGRAGYNLTKNLGIEALFDFVDVESKAGRDVNMYRYGGEFLYHFMPEKTFVPYVAAGLSAMKPEGQDTYMLPGYGVGAKYFLFDQFALRADVRHLMNNFTATDNIKHNLTYTVGAYFPFGGAAPAVKPVAAPAPVVAPAPAPVVLPPAPVAPSAALSAVPASIIKGSNSTLNWTSSNADACAIQPGIGSVPLKGSQSVSPAADTVYTLACTGKGGSVSKNAKVAVAQPAPKPAPVVAPAPVVDLCKPTKLNVAFDTDKAVIKPVSYAELDTVGAFLNKYPKAKGVIEGHTDSVGSTAYNQKLSQRRADAVRLYVVDKFKVDGARIAAKGYGESKPVATNKTAVGRAQNRRVMANFLCE
jgi:OOP family OmpA-OmpF porin